MHSTPHIIRDFGRAAQQYDAHATLQAEVMAECIAKAVPLIPSGARVLDAGCGTGRALALAGVRWRMLGVDIAPAMCARARMGGMETLCADLERLPLTETCIDGAISSLALQWVNDPVRVFYELRRVVKPEGHAVIATLGADTLQELRAAFAQAGGGQAHVSVFLRSEELATAARAAGWRGVACERVLKQKYYPDVNHLMRTLKAIGAANKRADRSKGLTGRALFARMEAAYREKYSTPQGIPATWEVEYMILG